MGGILLAGTVSDYLDCEVIFAEKKVMALADKGKGTKEVSELVIDRHEIKPGENIFIIEDVCNNFSTTEKLKTEIEKHGGNLIGIACAINRSGQLEWEGLPVISALFIPTEQYKQEDEEVAELVAAGKIVWKPKQEWQTLKDAMSGKKE
jgi:orotate phosphoribosyltransferase